MRIGGGSIVQVQAGGAPLSASGFAAADILNALGRGQVYGGTIAGTAGAGNKAIAEINNPNASGKTLFVYELEIWVPTAMLVQLVFDGTTLAPAGVPVNLLVGNATASIAKIGGGNQLTPTGTLVKNLPSLVANTAYTFPEGWIFAIPPNHNVQFVGQTVNQAMTVNFSHVEWAS